MSTVVRIRSVGPMGSSESGLGRFLVEWYGPTAGVGPIGETAGRLNDGAASLAAGGARIRLLMALAIPADDYAFGVFAAESADAVAQLCADAGAPPDRISPAVGWLRTPDG
jgi:hypothetical protein